VPWFPEDGYENYRHMYEAYCVCDIVYDTLRLLHAFFGCVTLYNQLNVSSWIIEG